jgi:shikimate kinase
MLDRHIFLIGMAGSGKSSLGKRVAANLKLPYIDTDRRIAELTGISVQEILQEKGEHVFRHAETNCLMTLLDDPPSIVSTGGGCVLNPVNCQIMRNHGVIILIDRPPEDIVQDIRLETRPLLQEKGAQEVPKIYAERIEYYRKAADMVLDNAYGYHNAVFMLEKMITSHFNLNRK